MSWQVLGAALLVCLGLLLGATWTTQVLQFQLRQQAQERRRLNEEWVAVHTTRSHGEKCPYCGYPLTDQDWYVEQTLAGDQPDDD